MMLSASEVDSEKPGHWHDSPDFHSYAGNHGARLDRKQVSQSETFWKVPGSWGFQKKVLRSHNGIATIFPHGTGRHVPIWTSAPIAKLLCSASLGFWLESVHFDDIVCCKFSTQALPPGPDEFLKASRYFSMRIDVDLAS